MAQFLAPDQQRGGKLKPKARWGLHLGVSEESKGWELLDIVDNWVVTTSDVVFYENMSLEVWKSEHGPASGRTPTIPPTDTSTATLPLLAKVGEPAAEDVEDIPSPFPSPAPRAPPLLADLRGLTRQVDVRVKSTPPGEEQVEEVQPTVVKSAKGAGTRQQLTGEQAATKPTKKQSATRQSAEEPTTGENSAGKPAEVQQNDEGSEAGDDRGDAEETTDSDVVEEDEDFPELDPDMHADPEHRWDISTMTVKEALASWKGKAVKAAMEEEIRSLVGMGTWELVQRPLGVNIMKSRWVLTTKYHIDDTVERKKARLVVKGFTQVYGDEYDKTYAPVSSYVTMRIFLSILAVLDLNLMQLDMKNAFLQSKLDQVLYMYKPDYFNDGTGRGSRRCAAGRWLEEEPGRHSALLQSRQRRGDLLATSSSAGMLKELKELLKAALELREISPVQKYLRLEIVPVRSVRKPWLHQQGYADKLRRRFLDEEQNGRTPKTSVSVDAYATLTFDDEEAQLGSGLTVRSDQYWCEVDRCLSYFANTRDTVLEFGGGAESLKLAGYVDADDAGDKQNQTSTGGYVFVFGGAAVSWTPTVLRVDNKSAITLTEGMGLSGNLKHMERRQAWLQHMVKSGKFSLRYIPTAEQPANFLTKALHYPTFNRCSVAIGQL
ncbi:unnamed protein product [Closterium sp. NIES-53]